MSTDAIVQLPVDCISRNQYQMRYYFDADRLEELAASIKEHGIIEPIVVRANDDEMKSHQYELICGERRWRAAQRAGLMQVPAIVRQCSDEVSAAIALIENYQRENLSPIEAARGIARLVEEFSYSQESVAQRLGISAATVSHYLRLMDLPNRVQTMLDEGTLTMGQAKAILSAPQIMHLSLASRAVKENLSVRRLESIVRQQGKLKNRDNKDTDMLALEEELTHLIGHQVKIQHDKSNWRGEFKIQYFSAEECEGIIEQFRK